MKKIVLLCLFILIFALVSCQDTPANTNSVTEPTDTAEPESSPAPETQDDPPSSDTAEEVDTEEAEKQALTLSGGFINPLTGLPSEKDFSTLRPAAIMINNIDISLPQVGVAQADILYECLVEGGYTRLMMVVADYESLSDVGSVRSARDYYLDMAANHDAIFIHAGGSPTAYSGIRDRFISNIDGVNMYTPSTFYRDENRMRTMGLEHSLLTTGEGIASGIEFKKYRTEKSKDYPVFFTFFEYGRSELPTGMTASKVDIPYSLAQHTVFDYDSESNLYCRSQNGQPHIDGTTGEQLTFENVLVIYCAQTYHNDGSGRISLAYTGSGSGYYAYGGMASPVIWSKDDRDAVMELENPDGSQFVINSGRTAICVVNKAVEGLVVIE